MKKFIKGLVFSSAVVVFTAVVPSIVQAASPIEVFIQQRQRDNVNGDWHVINYKQANVWANCWTWNNGIADAFREAFHSGKGINVLTDTSDGTECIGISTP